MLGWSAVMEPYLYTASTWTTQQSEVIAVDGRRLRELFDAKHIGYQVVKGIGEVVSRRFGQTVGGQGIDQLHQFRIFAKTRRRRLGVDCEESLCTRQFETAEELTAEGAAADRLYLFLKGKAEVKVRTPDGSQVLIDEVGPGELLGWSTVVEPYVYTASSWTTEPSEVIVIDGKGLRELLKQIAPRLSRGQRHG